MATGSIRGFVLVAAMLAALVASGTAWAKCGGQSGTRKVNPSVSQYVEQYQTSCGSKPLREAATPIPPKVSRKITRKIGNKPEASALRHVLATRSGQHLHVKKAKIPVATAGPSALGAGVGAVTGGSDAKLIALVAVLAGLAALALGKAVYRRRAER